MLGFSRLDRDSSRWWRPHYELQVWMSRFKVGLTPYVFHVGGAASGGLFEIDCFESDPLGGVPFDLSARNRGHDDDLTVMPDKFSIQL